MRGLRWAAMVATVPLAGYLEVHGSGASEIRYRGRPELNIHTSGASHVWRY